MVCCGETDRSPIEESADLGDAGNRRVEVRGAREKVERTATGRAYGARNSAMVSGEPQGL